MARTSSFAFKGRDNTVAEIADILDVQAVLEGSVRRSGERVRITAQLIDARSGYHIWSGSYHRNLTDIFALQDELARGIVNTLRVELGVESDEPLIPEQTSSLEAYNAFIRGRAIFDWSSPENLHESIRYFEKAVEADPDYALAWGNLAMARGITALWRPTQEVSPPTILAYDRALELDPEQSDALTIKAFMTQLLKGDWEAAGKLYERAMVSGENTMATSAYTILYLLPIDRIPEAIRLQSDAEKLDPLHAGTKESMASLLLWSGDTAAAIRKSQDALELNPHHFFAITAIMEAYLLAGNCATAIEYLQELPISLQHESRIRLLVARCYSAQGHLDVAEKIYSEIVEAGPMNNAISHAAELALSLGKVEHAIDMMERAADNKSWLKLYFRMRFRNHEALQNHPRFLSLLERIGLDDESVAALKRHSSLE